MIRISKVSRDFALIMAAFIVAVLVFSIDTSFAAAIQPYTSENIKVSEVGDSALTATGSGYTRVFDNGSKVCVEEYDKQFNIKSRKELPVELDKYGGFFAGKDAYYLLFGCPNTAENDAAEVYRVVKYSKSWKRLSAARLTGKSAFACQIRHPFYYGTTSMAECNGCLYFVDGHEGYVDPSVGQGHQGFIMYKVNESSMTGSVISADLWHSFSQHIAIKDASNFFILEESEGSEMAKLSKGDESDPRNESISVLDYGGQRTSSWAVATYATANDIALSSDNVITVGTSIDQSRYNDSTYNKTYNVYITTTPVNNFTESATTFRWLTTSNAKWFNNVKLTKINNDRFLVSWSDKYEEGRLPSGSFSALNSRVMHYVFINGAGAPVSKEFKVNGVVSNCDPIVDGGKVVFYASDNASVVFYSIDASTGAMKYKEYLKAGPSATWTFSNGVLTISGSGALNEELADEGLSSIGDKIKKIVIKKGITTISAHAFTNLDNLKEVVIEDGVKAIGDYAFAYNYYLSKVTIPDSVETFGENIFYTGYHWIGSSEPVYNVTIYCHKGSAAQKYAEKNNISCELLSGSGARQTLSKLESTITATRSERDAKGSVYSKLRLRSTAAGKKSITLKWNKVKGASKYVIFGNLCGKKHVKICTVNGRSKKIKKVAGKLLQKGKYYRFTVAAVDSSNHVVSCSKTIHVATSGGTVGNYKRVTIKKSIVNKAKKLKKGKKLKLNAKAVKKSSGLTVKKHVDIRYESSNKKIAKVTSKGIVKGLKKGKCYIYAYAQNGVSKKILVNVR